MPISVLDNLGGVDPGCLRIKTTVCLGERCALGESNADATTIIHDGGCDHEKSNSNSKERRFAEHTGSRVWRTSTSGAAQVRTVLPEKSSPRCVTWTPPVCTVFKYILRMTTNSALLCQPMHRDDMAPSRFLLRRRIEDHMAPK